MSGEIIFEFIPVGDSVKVCAVDSRTGFEVSIVGPAKTPVEDLERVAARKLRRQLEKRTSTGTGKEMPRRKGRGILT